MYFEILKINNGKIIAPQKKMFRYVQAYHIVANHPVGVRKFFCAECTFLKNTFYTILTL